MDLKFILGCLSILLGTSPIFASGLTFRTRTFDFDGGPRTEFYARFGDADLIYRPLPDWRFWKTDSGGAFENREDPRAGQLKFYKEPAPFQSSPGEVEEETLVSWFRRFVPTDAENVEMVSLRVEYVKFLSSSLSSCQFNYDHQGRVYSLKIWANPVDQATWLCFTYGNLQGQQFNATLSELGETFMRLNLEEK